MFNDIAMRNHEEMMRELERQGFDPHDESWHNNAVPSASVKIDGEEFEIFVPDDDEVREYAIFNFDQDLLAETRDLQGVIEWLEQQEQLTYKGLL
tara:strand:- start:54 stop:338 length:285 start_codon:yes stop_codon:yes gene_type:complete